MAQQDYEPPDWPVNLAWQVCQVSHVGPPKGNPPGSPQANPAVSRYPR